MTQTIGTAFERELRKNLDTAIAKLTEDMAAGMLSSFDEYRHKAGQIIGLRLAIDACDETARKLEER